MARINRAELTRQEIIRHAANRFLEIGYSKTSIHAMSKALDMSTGNMTFYFPTKEHILAELVDMLCQFQWSQMEYEAKEGVSSVMAVCLELLTMAAACEQEAVVKDFFLAAYSSRISLEKIRKNDKNRAKAVFGRYCPGWTDEQFQVAETLVSGIEYATLMTTESSAPLKQRIIGALNTIMMIYQVPEETRKLKIQKVLAMDYQKLGLRVLKEFRSYVEQTTQQALLDLLK